ncbi:hypothetical protein BCO9919_05103 [Burkholderia cenocepacia]|uniref:Uncharacterized protein n=1 Tax=Burkholderia cenocepacia TaxID=95486 RepID=A0A6J5JKP5_9BURK|nr:hypothetical protein BCO9919_05103 [Burkholderia cenocepacia]
MGLDQVLKRRVRPTAKHGAGLSAEAPSPADREAWGRTKR